MSDKMILGPDGKPLFISAAVVPGRDGKPQFIGQDELAPRKLVKQVEGSKMECPQCHQMVDYLLGNTDTNTGEMQGCEGCYKPPMRGTPKGGEQNGTEFTTDTSQNSDPKKAVFD
jgi:hypothetical protein